MPIRLLTPLALFALLTGALWTGVLWRWDVTRRDITAADIVVYLGVLPVFVSGMLLAFRRVWQGVGSPPPLRATSVPTPAGMHGVSSADDPAPRSPVTHLFSAHLLCAGGATPDALFESALRGSPRPALHECLSDVDGVPVLCARCADLPVDAVVAALHGRLSAMRERRPEWSGAGIDEQVVRALAALEGPLAQAIDSLQADADGRAAAPPIRLRLLLGLPAGWTEFEREAAGEWAHLRLGFGAGAGTNATLIAVAATSGPALWREAERMLETLAGDGDPSIVMLAACHSDLSDAAIGALERHQRLFSAGRRPRGVMPGEAAVVLVLAAGCPPRAEGAPLSRACLQRAVVMHRDTSIDAPGRTDSRCLTRAAIQALDDSALAAEEVETLVSDADQHTSRGAELHATALALMPHLSPGDDLSLLGSVTGHTGAVDALLTVAVAAARASAADKPCLALCVGDPVMRLAMLVGPSHGFESSQTRIDSMLR